MKRYGTVMGVVAFLVLAGLLQYQMMLSHERATRPKPFDPAAWREHVRLHDAELFDQASRLLCQRTLVGKTRAEVVELLGEPGRDRQPQDPRGLDGSDLIYFLQTLPGSLARPGIRWQWLVVKFGTDGRVSECFMRYEPD